MANSAGMIIGMAGTMHGTEPRLSRPRRAGVLAFSVSSVVVLSSCATNQPDSPPNSASARTSTVTQPAPAVTFGQLKSLYEADTADRTPRAEYSGALHRQRALTGITEIGIERTA